MKKLSLFLASLALVAGISASGWSIFDPRNYGWDPPPYEVNLWGTAGLLLADFSATSAAFANSPFAFDKNNDVRLFRTSWGVDFMFRLWILGLGLEYSQQTLERINFNSANFSASGYSTLVGNNVIKEAYTANRADALIGKLKLEVFNIIAEGGVGFYWPNKSLYFSYDAVSNNVTNSYVWSQTSTAAIDPKLLVMFSIGYPMQLSRDLDVVPFLRMNIFGSQTAISGKDLNALLASSNPSTLDIGVKLRIVFH